MKQTFSIIIPVYNTRPSVLSVLCENLKSQICTESDTVIFVDNGSVNWESLRAEIVRRGFQFVRELKPGSYSARNAGLRIVSSSHVIFTDDDCMPSRDWLNAFKKTSAEFPKSMLAGCVNVSVRTASFGECYDALTAFDQEENVTRGYSTTANLCVPAEYFSKYGMFDDRLFSGGDVEFTRRLTSLGVGIRYVDKARVSHPARTAFQVLSKVRRVTAGHYQKLAINGSCFTPFDYAKSFYKPIKVLRARRKISLICRLRASVFAFGVSLYRVYCMATFQFGLSDKIPRD